MRHLATLLSTLLATACVEATPAPVAEDPHDPTTWLQRPIADYQNLANTLCDGSEHVVFGFREDPVMLGSVQPLLHENGARFFYVNGRCQLHISGHDPDLAVTYDPHTRTQQLTTTTLASILAEACALEWDAHLNPSGFDTINDGSTWTLRLGDTQHTISSAHPKSMNRITSPSDRLAHLLHTFITTGTAARFTQAQPITHGPLRVILQRLDPTQAQQLISEYGLQDPGMELSTITTFDNTERYCNEGGSTLLSDERADTLRTLRDRIAHGQQPGAQQSGTLRLIVANNNDHYMMLIRDALPAESASGVIDTMNINNTICYP